MAANPKPHLSDPVPISINGVTPDPKNAEIDYEGSIQFTSDDECNIEWEDEHGKKNTYWSPQPSSVGANNKVQSPLPPAKGHTLKYTLSNDSAGQGGGTVKVGSN